MRLLHRLARHTRLTRLLSDAALQDAMIRAAAATEPQARPGRQCRDCGNRAGTGACVKACGGAR